MICWEWEWETSLIDKISYFISNMAIQLFIFTARIGSMGKVMFSQACVILSTGGWFALGRQILPQMADSLRRFSLQIRILLRDTVNNRMVRILMGCILVRGCIPVGCVPPASVSVSDCGQRVCGQQVWVDGVVWTGVGVWTEGYKPLFPCPSVCWDIHTLLSRHLHPHPSAYWDACRQNDWHCENITFPQLRLRAVKRWWSFFHHLLINNRLSVPANTEFLFSTHTQFDLFSYFCNFPIF